MVLDVKNAGLYLERMLDYHDPQAIRRKYPTLPFDEGSALPIKETLPMGVDTITQELIDGVGETVEFTQDLTDVPVVEVAIGETVVKTQRRAIGSKYTIMDLEKMRVASANGQIYSDIVAERNKVALRVMAEYGNATGAYGVPQRGMTGALNNPNVPIENDTTDPYFLSDNDLVSWFTEKITAVEAGTNLVEEPNVIRVTKKLHKRICSILPNDNYSVKQSILTTNESILAIVPFNEGRFDQLEKFGVNPVGTNRSLMWIYNLNDESLKRMTSSLDRLPLEYSTGCYTNIWLKAFAEVQVMYPESMRYVTYPEDSIV